MTEPTNVAPLDGHTTLTNIVTFTVDGVAYDIDLFDIDGVEWRDAKRASGMLQQEIIRQGLAGELDAVAALLWVWRRRGEPGLTYEALLRSLSLKSGLPVEGVQEADADPPPEAGAVRLLEDDLPAVRRSPVGTGSADDGGATDHAGRDSCPEAA